MSAITFLDRLAIAVTEPGIRADLRLGPEKWGWILSAYVLANAIFEIPSGARGDQRGQQSELTRIVLWWSAFTAVTGWCRNFLQMVGTRFLFGLGTAGAYPNASGVIAKWFPYQEHARVQGFVWAAGRMGAALAPLLLVPLERICGWRAVFWVMGGVGFLWAIAWWTSFRAGPKDVNTNKDEPQNISAQSVLISSGHKIPWRRLLAMEQLWLIMTAYFCYAWGSWFFFGWFTTWMVRGEGFSVAQMGIFASFPFVMAMFGNLIGGNLSRRLVLKMGEVSAYRWVTSSCLVIGAALLLAMSMVREHKAIVALATVSFGVMDLMLPSAWAMCMGLGGRRCGGTATAMMNTAGNLGGWVCALVFGYVVKATGNYNLPLQLIAAMVLLAALLFARVNCAHGLSGA